MLLDIHGSTTSIPVSISTLGDNTIIAAQTAGYIYIHELIGDPASAVTLTIKAGSRSLGTFDIDAGQGLTEQDVAGNDGVPRFICYPGEAFILTLSGAVSFKGSCQYSLRTS